VGCYNGLALYDGNRFKKFTTEDGLPGNKISVLKVVKGKLVVGTMQNGLSIRQGRLFVNATMATGLSDDRIEALEADERGVWVGTINGLNLVEVR
jgi:ligand-binding sensor domain-containing protein